MFDSSLTLRHRARQVLATRLGVPDMRSALTRLAKGGLSPRVVCDVGAYQGDFSRLCLDIWPATRIVAFEVLPHRVEQLRDLTASGGKVQVVPCLLGAADRESVPFREIETASSVLQEHVNAGIPTNPRPMRALDALVREGAVPPPDFIKLDVQGYELEVLKGAEQTLASVQGIVAELNFLDIHQGVPLAGDVIAWLAARGWLAHDICGLTRRPLDNALWQADFVFVREGGALRADKRWA